MHGILLLENCTGYHFLEGFVPSGVYYYTYMFNYDAYRIVYEELPVVVPGYLFHSYPDLFKTLPLPQSSLIKVMY